MPGRGQYSLSDIEQPPPGKGQYSLADVEPDKPEEKSGALARFGSAFDPRPLIKQIFKPAEDPNEDGFTSLAKNLLGIGKNLVDAQGAQYTEATKAFKEGRYKDAVAAGISALVPVLGPMSQVAAEKFNKGDWAGGFGTLASMGLPELSRGAGAAVETGQTALAAAKAALKAGGRDVAIGTGKAAVGTAIAHLPVPGAAVVGGLVDYGAGKQVLRGVKAGYQAGKEAIPAAVPAETPVSRVQAGFDPATARIQTPPVDPRVARVAEAFNPETAWPADTEGIPPARMAGAQPVPRGTPDNFSWPAETPIESIPPTGQPPTPPVTPAPQAVLPYAESVNPDVARTLTEGTQRVGKDGGAQTLRQVPIEHIEGDPGNTIYPERVDEYQKNGYAVHPELRANPEGGYTINEGHHRILADVRNGKDSVLAWTPELSDDAAAERIKQLTQPPPIADAMQDLSPAMRTAAADANYRAVKEGAPAAEAGPVYESAARANKIETLGKHLMERGFTAEEMRQFPPAKLKEGLAQKVKELGINQKGTISDKSISDLLKWMEINYKP